MYQLISDNRFRFCDNGLAEVKNQPTFDDWCFTWRQLKTVDNAMPWAIGDLYVYGEDAFGEMISQELEASEHDEHSRFTSGTLNQYRYVSRQWPVQCRLTLPWSYHQATAHLPMIERLALMQRCLNEGIKRAELRKLANGHNSGKSPNPPTQTQDTITELIQDNYEKDKHIARLESKLRQAGLTVDGPIISTDNPADLPAYITRAIASIQNWLCCDGGEDYASVTISKDGETWNK